MASFPGDADIVVIGGGIMGCAAAYHLARMGRDVVLLERDIISGQASGRSKGGVRQQGRHPSELPIAMESVRMWETLDQELDAETEYRRGGNLIFAVTQDEVTARRKAVATQQEAGLGIEFLAGDETRKLLPSLGDRVLAASYCSTDGQANPYKSTAAFFKAAVRLGVRGFPHTPVRKILERDGRVEGVMTDAGEIRASIVVNAAGPWAPFLVKPLGINLPIWPRVSQVLITERVPMFLPQFVGGSTVRLRQTNSGNVMISGGGPWDPVTFEQRPYLSTLIRFASRARMLFPMLERVAFLRSYAATLEMTPDSLPVIDALDSPRGLVILAGFSAHGFALGPAIGKLTAELIATGRPSISLDAFRLSRFRQDVDYLREYQENYAGTTEPSALGDGEAEARLKEDMKYH